MEEGLSAVVVNNEGEADHDVDDVKALDLPPGFRFHPTDEEIITHYLSHKVFNTKFSAIAMGEVDLNKCEPWDLPKKAKMGEKEWFFFCKKDRKYPTGTRTNRATESGYWKATGKDKEIYNTKRRDHNTSTAQQKLIGMKKTLVFYKGRAPKGEKSNWVMHEFRLEGLFSYYNFPKSFKDEWVVCRVVHKKGTGTTKTSPTTTSDLTSISSFVEGLLDSPSLPPLMDSPNHNNYNPNERSNDSNCIKTSGTNFIPEDFEVAMLDNNPSMINNQLQMQPQNYSFNPMTYYQTAQDPTTNIYQVPDSIFYQNAIRCQATRGTTLTYPPQQMIINTSPTIFLGSTNDMQLANQALKVEQIVKSIDTQQATGHRT